MSNHMGDDETGGPQRVPPPADGDAEGGHAAARLREQLLRDLGEVPEGPPGQPHDAPEDENAAQAPEPGTHGHEGEADS